MAYTTEQKLKKINKILNTLEVIDPELGIKCVNLGIYEIHFDSETGATIIDMTNDHGLSIGSSDRSDS